jgi:hypothetical protein
MMAEAATKLLPARDTDPWIHVIVDRKGTKATTGRLIPRVGVGASHGHGSDCYPFTIVAVSKTGHQITLRADNAKVVKGDFRGGGVECEFTAREEYVDDITGTTDRIATRRNNEHKCGNCGGVSKVSVEKCDRTIGCTETEQEWYPVYKWKGDSYRGAGSIGIGYRFYHQDPHF